ncbi:uncharacterized protein ARMOST_06229 [Armillaria ostoyae]|uniref:Uncharacterized protein n=1 Tax=Armillaria ostoyae TaxID=47428 RepID=A0A284R2G2_ARMOS|nr:uncharacterized protein ARMOST_06229 [Armillaria ostoyae]
MPSITCPSWVLAILHSISLRMSAVPLAIKAKPPIASGIESSSTVDNNCAAWLWHLLNAPIANWLNNLCLDIRTDANPHQVAEDAHQWVQMHWLAALRAEGRLRHAEADGYFWQASIKSMSWMCSLDTYIMDIRDCLRTPGVDFHLEYTHQRLKYQHDLY